VYVPSRKSLLTITKAGHLTEWASEDWSSQPMASRQALTLLPETEIVRLAPEHDNLALANAEGQVLVWPMNLAFETAPDFGLTRVDV
jgi:hypothetical protein